MDEQVVRLTEEQRAVVACAAPPAQLRTSVVMCAAGTGKTTTMVAVAARLVELGHQCVRYAVFDAEAGRGATERMPSSGVVVKTMHAHALDACTHWMHAHKSHTVQITVHCSLHTKYRLST